MTKTVAIRETASTDAPPTGEPFMSRLYLPDERQRPYCAFLPRAWSAPRSPAERAWPLILYLAGIGELRERAKRGLAEIIESSSLLKYAPDRDQRFVIVAPQLAAGEVEPFIRLAEGQEADPGASIGWQLCRADLGALVEHAITRYGVNPDQICLIGISVGACAAWDLAVDPLPGVRWAAVVPFAGIGDPAKAGQLEETRVWAFVNQDEKYPRLRDGTVAMCDALARYERNFHRKTVFRRSPHPRSKHNCWNPVFEGQARDDAGRLLDLYAWLEDCIAP